MRVLVLIFSLFMPLEVLAQDWDVNIGAVTDYRDRGVSQSDKDPAIQGSIEAWFENGLSFGVWASTIEKAPSGGDAEINLYASYSDSLGALGFWTLGAQFVSFVDGDEAKYGEIYGILGVDYGFATASLNLTYTPDRNDLDAGDNLYTQGRIDAHYPGSGFGLSLTTGFDYYQRFEDKWDWSVGAFYQWDKLTFTLDYVDTNKSGALRDAAVVAGVKFSF